MYLEFVIIYYNTKQAKMHTQISSSSLQRYFSFPTPIYNFCSTHLSRGQPSDETTQ
ncbi:hypothetical protein M378DRAFT_167900 [Amanita muscaria Koide BX008]|uniref:Uncharacterized protein n=1 Tax=Amanita muscaria (strain Koide BX008) TaxID=946122 RepID=A0A0C2WWE4_AMAMK|nr:hypothetical protein M378DRAFT_167900 [Amanita muscaria Koide BX008]